MTSSSGSASNAAHAEESALHMIAGSFAGAQDRAAAGVAEFVARELLADVPTLHAVGLCFLHFIASRYPTGPPSIASRYPPHVW